MMEVNSFAKRENPGTKKQYVAALSEELKAACVGVIVNYKGITVAGDASSAATSVPPARPTRWSRTRSWAALCRTPA